MSANTRRLGLAWCGLAVCVLVIVGVVVAALRDLKTGDQIASVVAAVVALIGLGVSIWTLTRSAPAVSDKGSMTTAKRRVTVRGRGAVGAGGDIRGNAIGPRAAADISRSTKNYPPAGPAVHGKVRATGAGSVSAGGDITDNAIGEDSTR